MKTSPNLSAVVGCDLVIWPGVGSGAGIDFHSLLSFFDSLLPGVK